MGNFERFVLEGTRQLHGLKSRSLFARPSVWQYISDHDIFFGVGYVR